MRIDPPRTAEEIRLEALLEDARQRLHRAEQARRTLRQQNRKLRRRIKHLERVDAEFLEITQEAEDLARANRERSANGAGEGRP